MALPQQAPGNAGSFIPIAIDLAAASWGQYLAKNLVRFKQGRQGEAPNWEGRGEDSTTGDVGVPLTDREWWSGRYVLCEVTLEGEDGSRLTLPDAVATVSRERRIVSTALTGRNGTVKEYVSEGDWQIGLTVGVQAVRNGVIADEWPSDELRELRKMLEGTEALKVHSEFLDVFGITRIVVKGYSATQMTDQNYQAVSISAVSDEEIDLWSEDYND